jgi:hypothetical protein
VDRLSAHFLVVLVHALKPQEAHLRVLRQVCDVLADLFEALSFFQDGLGENVDITSSITSGLIIRLGGKKDQIHGKRKVDDRNTYY